VNANCAVAYVVIFSQNVRGGVADPVPLPNAVIPAGMPESRAMDGN